MEYKELRKEENASFRTEVRNMNGIEQVKEGRKCVLQKTDYEDSTNGIQRDK